VPALGADETEREAGKLLLHCGDHAVDLVAAVRFGERVDIAGVLGPQFADEAAPDLRVGLVPAVDVALDGVLHGMSLPQSGVE
jgi:hypothetical protein